MYTLCSGLYRQWTAKTTYNVLILGLDDAGKTSLVEQLKATAIGNPASKPHRILPTVGLNVSTVQLGRGRVANCWDLGGQLALRSMWEHYLAEAHAVLFVVDAADDDRLAEARRELARVLQHPLIADAPVAIIANKQDKQGAHSVHALLQGFALWELLAEWAAAREGGLIASVPHDAPGAQPSSALQQPQQAGSVTLTIGTAGASTDAANAGTAASAATTSAGPFAGGAPLSPIVGPTAAGGAARHDFCAVGVSARDGRGAEQLLRWLDALLVSHPRAQRLLSAGNAEV